MSLSYIIELGPLRVRFLITKSKAPMMKTRSLLRSDMHFRNLTSLSGNAFSNMMLSSPSSISHVQRYDLSIFFTYLFLNYISITQDASWLLPPSSPLKCISPADVYLLLKSSDFIIHDLNPETVFEGCHLDGGSSSSLPPYDLELVLRKWYPVDRSRELRCFVRGNLLIGKQYISTPPYRPKI